MPLRKRLALYPTNVHNVALEKLRSLGGNNKSWGNPVDLIDGLLEQCDMLFSRIEVYIRYLNKGEFLHGFLWSDMETEVALTFIQTVIAWGGRGIIARRGYEGEVAL